MKYLDLMGSMQAATQKANFNICTRNLRKICCKYHIEKPILLNFVGFLYNLLSKIVKPLFYDFYYLFL